MQDYLVLQAIIIQLCNIFIIFILGFVHPYEVISRNYTSMFSEFVIIIIMDTLLISSDPTLEPNSHQTIGWLIIAVMGLSIILS